MEAATAETVRTEEIQLPNGVFVAATLAAAIAVLSLALANLATQMSTGANDAVFALGKAWVPGASGIGPYSGKETILLIGWIGSWMVLHLTLRRRTLNMRLWFGVVLALIAAAVALIWPPIFEAIAGK